MPRPSWSGLLKLSLVSCPVYLSPATSEAERIRLNMINPATGNRIAMQTVDSETREEIARSETVKGYQVEKGQYVILTDDEVRDLNVESSRVIELSSFVERSDVDPLYIADPYFIYPEKHGEEAYLVISEALKNKDRVAIGRVVLSTREHPVMIEPFGDGGLLMSKLRAPDEVRQADFEFKTKIDKQMVDLAETIMDRLAGEWNPSQFEDRYQEALRGLIEAKHKGQPLPKGSVAPEATNVVDLMAVLKRSLLAASTNGNEKKAPAKKAKGDRRQGSMLLPVKGGAKAAEVKVAEPAKTKRKKAS